MLALPKSGGRVSKLYEISLRKIISRQGCIFRLTCSHPELTEDHVLTSAYVKIFRIVTRNAVNKSFWRKKDCSWPPLNKYAMNIWLSSLRIKAHISWRTGKHLHVLHVLQTYPMCSYPGYQDTTTYAALCQSDFYDWVFLPVKILWCRQSIGLKLTLILLSARTYSHIIRNAETCQASSNPSPSSLSSIVQIWPCRGAGRGCLDGGLNRDAEN